MSEIRGPRNRVDGWELAAYEWDPATGDGHFVYTKGEGVLTETAEGVRFQPRYFMGIPQGVSR